MTMAANHLALVSDDISLRMHAYLHQREAVRQLQQLTTSPLESRTEFALAVCVDDADLSSPIPRRRR
jgi:hypothetical protein